MVKEEVFYSDEFFHQPEEGESNNLRKCIKHGLIRCDFCLEVQGLQEEIQMLKLRNESLETGMDTIKGIIDKLC